MRILSAGPYKGRLDQGFSPHLDETRASTLIANGSI